MESIGKLFGSEGRIKIMRLFLENPGSSFSLSDIAKRSKIKPENGRREINLLKSSKFAKFGKKGWSLNTNFPRLEILKALLLGSQVVNKEELPRRFKKIGKLKLLAVAGALLDCRDSRVDILLVGDDLKKSQIEGVIKDLEAELGRELAYAVFETQEFIYRFNMYDKLIFDILDFPHEVLYESRELSTINLRKT